MKPNEMRDAIARSEAEDDAVLFRSAHRERKRKLITGAVVLAICVFVVVVIITAVGSGEGKREALLREHGQPSQDLPVADLPAAQAPPGVVPVDGQPADDAPVAPRP